MKDFKSYFKNTFITGILLMLPLAISAWIALIIFNKIDKILSPLITKIVGYHIPGLGFILTFLIVLITGIAGTNLLGKKLFNKFDKFMLKLPLISTFYGTTKQLIDAFELSKKLPFNQVALAEYPRKGIFVIAFIMQAQTGEIQEITPANLISLFIPSTPNPTTGWLTFIPEEDVIPINLSVEDALKLVISGGIVTPLKTSLNKK